MSDQSPFRCRFEFTPDSRAVVIVLTGSLDAEAVEELHPQVQEVYQAGVRRFVFDLSRLQHAGSLGLRLLLSLYQQVKGDGRVALCGPPAPIQGVLEMMKLQDVLPVYATRDEAVAATARD